MVAFIGKGLIIKKLQVIESFYFIFYFKALTKLSGNFENLIEGNYLEGFATLTGESICHDIFKYF